MKNDRFQLAVDGKQSFLGSVDVYATPCGVLLTPGVHHPRTQYGDV